MDEENIFFLPIPIHQSKCTHRVKDAPRRGKCRAMGSEVGWGGELGGDSCFQALYTRSRVISLSVNMQFHQFHFSEEKKKRLSFFLGRSHESSMRRRQDASSRTFFACMCTNIFSFQGWKFEAFITNPHDLSPSPSPQIPFLGLKNKIKNQQQQQRTSWLSEDKVELE